jgi:predicted nucleotidyltransferase component of viral defense system
VALSWHETDPVLLREAIVFTAAETGFLPRLIEKDYFCSVLLEYLAAGSDALIFKGGTCLSKVHVGFYRLSEDLDFSISSPPESTRSERKAHSARLKKLVAGIAEHRSVFRIVEPLTGANASTQYNAVLGYRSLLDDHEEPVRIEVGIREPVMTEPLLGLSSTLLQSPIDAQPLVEAFPVRCLSYFEAMAEKLRAALCRRQVAIRDFFDVDHAVHQGGLDIRDPLLLDLARRKLEIQGTAAMDVSPARLVQLQRQLDEELRPVLRQREFAQFDLQRAIETVLDVARVMA